MLLLILLLTSLLATSDGSRQINFEDAGGRCCDDSLEIELANKAVLNSIVGKLQRGDTLIIPPKNFHIMGGISASGVAGAVFVVNGNLKFSNKIEHWPRRLAFKPDIAFGPGV